MKIVPGALLECLTDPRVDSVVAVSRADRVQVEAGGVPKPILYSRT